MSPRVYILLDTVEGKAEEVVEILRGTAGVKLVDVLEGRPNVVMVLQARSRRELAELTNRALASVGKVTEGLQLLPSANGCGEKLHNRRHCKVKTNHGEHYLENTGVKEGQYGRA